MVKTKQSANKQFNKEKPKSPTPPIPGKKVGKQGRLDPSLPPTQKITMYTPESPSPAAAAAATQIDEGDESDDEVEEEQDQEEEGSSQDSVTHSNVVSIKATAHSIGTAGRNVILKDTKNKQDLENKCAKTVFAWKQGKGHKLLFGNEKKHFFVMKKMKMTFAHMAKSGINQEQCALYLAMPSINLKSVPGYQLLSADIVAHLVDILRNECHMLNVDAGDVAEYFDTRFADTRNRRHYVPE
jgi:hypothetical protein